jgi:hypothetical protein
LVKADRAALTPDAQRVSIRARMSSPRTATGERHAPTVIEVDHALVVRLRPEAARRDLPGQNFDP